MATQYLFDNDNSASNAELDANFTQTFDRINKISTASDTLSAGTYAFHIDASYRTLTGNTTALATRVGATGVTGQWQLVGTSTGAASQFQAAYAAGGLPIHAFGRSLNATVGAHTIVTSGTELGRITAAGSDGTQFTEGARIAFFCDGTPGTDDMPGRIDFSTTPDGSNAPTLVLRLSNDNSALFKGVVRSDSATGGIGYATGAGGTVTQATSKSTGVTLNNVCGNITMDNAALAANTAVSFTLTNSAIATGDLVLCNHISGGTFGAYHITGRSASGSATISVRNLTAGSLSEAVVVKFAVLKGVTA